MAQAMGTKIAIVVAVLALVFAGVFAALIGGTTDSSHRSPIRPSPAGVQQWIQDHTIPT